MISYDPAKNAFLSDEVITGIIPNLMWHITDQCPLKCPYCFSPKTEASTPRERIQPRVAAVRTLGVLKIDISGGEPLVYPFLGQLCQAIAHSGLAQTITTSGIGTRNNAEFVVSSSYLFSRIILSIDAPSADLHDGFRGSGAFKAAMEIARRIGEADRAKVRINTVVTRRFIQEGWHIPMEEVACAVGEWCLVQPHPANEKPTFSFHSVTDSEFNAFVSEVQRRSKARILVRKLEQYASYWSLQPNGELRQHTRRACDGLAFNIDSDDLAAVKRRLQTVSTWVPTV